MATGLQIVIKLSVASLLLNKFLIHLCAQPLLSMNLYMPLYPVLTHTQAGLSSPSYMPRPFLLPTLAMGNGVVMMMIMMTKSNDAYISYEKSHENNKFLY